MERMEQLYTKIDKKIIILIGRVCSGKTTFSTILKQNLQFRGEFVEVVDIGNLVREITDQENRVFKSQLDIKIIEKLNPIIKQCREKNKTLIIVGPRQKSILKGLDLKEDEYQNIVMSCSLEERQKRYIMRNDKKDGKTSNVEEIDRFEDELGLQELMDSVKENCIIIKT